MRDTLTRWRHEVFGDAARRELVQAEKRGQFGFAGARSVPQGASTAGSDPARSIDLPFLCSEVNRREPRFAIFSLRARGVTKTAAAMFIVQGKSREPAGIVKVTKATREEALQTANDLQSRGLPFVTIICDGRVYTMEEFASTIGQSDRTDRGVAAAPATSNEQVKEC